jgi:hypothetical protein
MKVMFGIWILLLLFSCKENTHTPDYCYTNIFQWFDTTNPKDTIKFYGFTDFDSAMTCAKEEKKNLLIIFSGWNLSERGIEWKTLSLYGNNDFIQKNFVIAWLPVDDKRKAKNKNTTIGKENAELQEWYLRTSSQPMFCFSDTTGHGYGIFIHYTKNKEEVKKFISSGIKK